MGETLEKRTIARVSWRLLPLIVVIYFVAYIDRTNVGFAAIGMNKELGFTAYIYGWGAGVVVSELPQLLRQVHRVPEEQAIEILAPDRPNQSFDERM